MLRGCRAVPQAVRRTKVQRANARFLSSGKAAPAIVNAARNANKIAPQSQRQGVQMSKAGEGGSEILEHTHHCLVYRILIAALLSLLRSSRFITFSPACAPSLAICLDISHRTLQININLYT